MLNTTACTNYQLIWNNMFMTTVDIQFTKQRDFKAFLRLFQINNYGIKLVKLDPVRYNIQMVIN